MMPNYFKITLFSLFFIPLSALAAEPTYNFPITVNSPDGSSEQITFPLPFDAIASIAALDLGDDGTSELLFGAPMGSLPQARLLRQDGSTILSWFPYNPKFRGGVAAVAADLNGDKKPEIVTAPLGAGGPHLKVFDTFGKLLSPGFFAPSDVATIASLERVDIEGDGRDELALIATNKKGVLTRYLLTGQGALIESAEEKSIAPKTIALKLSWQGQQFELVWSVQAKIVDRPGKVILVDLSDQKLSYYQDGFSLASYPVSTGRWGFPTPIGEFAVQNKIPRAYSKAYGLYMPFWMAFYRGQYGIHELPEWPNGYKEGANHLGVPVSHGCIRLGVGPAKTLYDWAEVGTTVIVQK